MHVSMSDHITNPDQFSPTLDGCTAAGSGSSMVMRIEAMSEAQPRSDHLPLASPFTSHENHVHDGIDTYERHLSKVPVRKRPRVVKSRPDIAYARKRATTACNLCRARKIKCNNARPSCSSCIAASSTCVYGDPQDQSSFDPASILILDRLNQVLSKLDRIQVPNIPGVISTVPVVAQRSATHTDNEPSQHQSDQLKIPARQTTPDAVLQWPIFQNRFPTNYITDAIFVAEDSEYDSDLDLPPGQEQLHSRPGTRGIDEDAIPALVRRFLELVHIKNPILDVKTIMSYAFHVAEFGLGWDPSSCLVLIACALGCVAEPFDTPARPAQTSLEYGGSRLQNAEAYYNMARRRFGFLDRGIVVPQCHFLAGVYLMYTMRPLLAWIKFQEASRSYHLYLQCQMRRPLRASGYTSRRRALEQRLYWSCYKSECELRVELDLPNSSLAEFDYPDMHPSPPDLDCVDEASPRNNVFEDEHYQTTNHDSLNHLREQQRQSWFYYLTEITLRRIFNNVLNTLYADSYASWDIKTIRYKLRAAEQFNEQLLHWYSGVPDQIRFSEEEFHAEELPYMIQLRVLHLQSIIGLPFLYHSIHNAHDAPCQSMLQAMAQQALEKCLRQVSNDRGYHRHHGTWNWTRSNTTSALVIIASATSGTVVIPSDWKGLIEKTIVQLRYWESEAPGLSRCAEVLEDALDMLTIPEHSGERNY